MLQFWKSLELFQQILFLVAIPATLILILQLILLLIGIGGQDSSFDDAGDIDTDTDADLSGDDPVNDFSISDIGGLKLFTLRGVLAFFAIGSWSALVASTGGKVWLSLLVGLLAGAAADVILALIMKSLRGLQQSGNIEIGNAVGKIGEVYIPIPPDRSGLGKVNVVMQERLVELDAVTDSERMLRTGEEIRITDTVGSSVVAAPIKE